MRHGPLCALLATALALPLLPLSAAPQRQGAPAAGAAAAPREALPLGYYRFPAIHGETIVFTAEGDLWRVPVTGGVAQRLTTHPGEESNASISADGRTIAFTARYEGPAELYTMPLEGGLPVRRTFDGGGAQVVGWTPDGKILYATGRFATLPNVQLAVIDPGTDRAAPGVVASVSATASKGSALSQTRTFLPLAQASDGSYDPSGKTLVFTRLRFQGSHTKRYQGGTAQNLWRWDGTGEAVPLTADYAGTSKTPMWWQGRVYFASDRDGVMNLWSITPEGKDPRQHTFHTEYDVQSPALQGGRIVYQHGADLRLLDLGTGTDRLVPIRLSSDFDQMREKWITKPMEWVTSAHLAPSGDRVALTARGQVFVAPVGQGRLVEATRSANVRYRDARFLPDGKQLLTLSDESGEVELWTLPANGIGARAQLTRDGTILRWEAVPSSDGRWIAHHDKNQQLWLYDAGRKVSQKIASSHENGFGNLAWSPDSRYLAFTETAPSSFDQIKLYDTATGRTTALTTDRYDSYAPAWSPDGEWIYFLSDRNFQSLVGSPWGPRQPEPFFDRQTKIYKVALRPGLRSPFQPADELAGAAPERAPDASAVAEAKGAGKKGAPAPATPAVAIELDGLAARLYEVPVPAGNYSALTTDGKRLYWLSRETTPERKASLQSLEIKNERPRPEVLVEDVRGYELSQDKKKLLVRKGDDLYVIGAGAKPSNLAESKVDLSGWRFALDPREEWRQMFTEAWRLERDYFYDPGMHGLDWRAVYQKYLPLAERVTSRAELSDVLAQMVGELSALHIYVYGGDLREGTDDVSPASLGAVLTRDERAGGFRVDHIYRTDPDRPERLAPLARPGVGVAVGDVILAINGVDALGAVAAGELLRHQAGKQVLLKVRAQGGGAAREVVVTPISAGAENSLRYDEWEYTRRLRVDSLSGGRIGYVHLRAMGSSDIADWAREFYPVHHREALIVDVRHNRGGNIDSWILEKLMRRAWFYWQPRVGNPTWNMQYAFRGPMMTLVNEETASDGEAFAEGFRRLGLGKVLGTRTWGGEIWLTSSNVLVDRGIATAAEIGVFGPEGAWLIEGHGVEPDIVVDNLPHATFNGSDAQLEAAVRHLLEELEKNPVEKPRAPAYPDKSRGGAGR